MIYEYIPYHISHHMSLISLRQVNQPGGSMMIYEYILDQMSLKSLRSRTRDSRRIYEYIPHQMSIKSLRKVDQELQ